MVRLVGVDLPPNKNVEVALTYIYGIGRTLSGQILAKTNVDPLRKVKDLNDADVVALREELKNYKVEGDLRKDITMDIKRLMDIGTYRGSRHRKGLPCRGQRTRTNGRTKRGKRLTVGLGKKKEEEKKE
ncbi:MAG: 30S ribosomal protein S13 [Candidatus Margulisbacteria bacterium]|nr:30S ribosomal protein S13 [Candidatus Margulisiibacteriota bacterium]